MSDRLAECTWPQLPAPFDRALREATRYVFDEVQPIGIVATGTIIRGQGDASSDLDIYVVHEAPYRRRVQRFFSDVPAEIFINPPHTIRKYFQEEHNDGRPLTAHMLATGTVVYSSNAILEALRSEAGDWLRRIEPLSEIGAIRERYGIASRLEDGADVAQRDSHSATMLLTGAVVAMLEHFCRMHSGRVPRGKELLATVEARDAEIGRLAKAFFDASSVAERLHAANALADRTIGARGFFEWDSGPDPVPAPDC